MSGKSIAMVICAAVIYTADASAQESCNALLEHGIFDRVRETTEVQNNSTIQKALCATYSKYKRDKKSEHVEASYGMFGASGGLSNEQIESIGQYLCSSDFSDAAAKTLVTTSSELISAPALDAWRQCQQQYSDGLRSDTTINDEATIVSVSVRYVRPAGVSRDAGFSSVKIQPPDAFQCDGSLVDLEKGTPLTVNYGMVCRRTLADKPFVGSHDRLIRANAATIFVDTEAGTVVRHFSALPAEPSEVPPGVGEIKASMLSDEQFRKVNGTGWILADGRQVPGTAYERFVGKIVPDLRGMFLRGKNNGRISGGNPDGELALGYVQEDELKKHSHAVNDSGHVHRTASGYDGAGEGGPPYTELTDGGSQGRGDHYSSSAKTGVTIGETGGKETRPRNVTVNYFIRVD